MLVKIIEETRRTYENIESRIKAEGFRSRVMQILKAWSDWAIYPKEFLIRIQNTFLGLSPTHVSYESFFFLKMENNLVSNFKFHSFYSSGIIDTRLISACIN